MAEPDLRTELAKADHEPLLPIEMKLIRWSLGVGITMLVLLAILNHIYPAT